MPSSGQLRRGREGVVERLLGEIEIAKQPDEGGEYAPRVRTVDGIHRLPHAIRRVAGPLIFCHERLAEDLDRPHLDAAEQRRNERRDLNRIIQIAGFDEVVAAQLLLRLGKGTIRGR